MMKKHGGSRTGLKLVKAVLALAVVLIFAALSIYYFGRGPKRTASDDSFEEARQILEELRIIDSAVDQFAIENCKCAGTPVQWADIQRYLRPDSRLYSSGGLDPLGSAYRTTSSGDTFKVDEPPILAPDTFKAFSDIAPKEFWSPYLN